MEDKKQKKGKETIATMKAITSTNKQETSDPLDFLSSDSNSTSNRAINVVRFTDYKGVISGKLWWRLLEY